MKSHPHLTSLQEHMNSNDFVSVLFQAIFTSFIIQNSLKATYLHRFHVMYERQHKCVYVKYMFSPSVSRLQPLKCP